MVGRVSLPSGTRFNLRYPSWIQFTLPILLEHTCIYKIIYDYYHKLYIYIHILYIHSLLKKTSDTNSPQFTIPQQMWGQKSPCCFVVSPGKIPTPPWPSTELDRHWPLTHDSWHRGRWISSPNDPKHDPKRNENRGFHKKALFLGEGWYAVCGLSIRETI